MFEHKRLARMADSGEGREKGGKNLFPPLLQLQVHRPLPWNIFYFSQPSTTFIIHWEGGMIHLVGIESDWAPTKIHLLWRLIVSYLLHRKAWHSHSSWYRSDIPCTEDHSVHTHCHRRTHNASHIQRLFENTLRERLQHQLVKTTADKPQLKENTFGCKYWINLSSLKQTPKRQFNPNRFHIQLKRENTIRIEPITNLQGCSSPVKTSSTGNFSRYLL